MYGFVRMQPNAYRRRACLSHDGEVGVGGLSQAALVAPATKKGIVEGWAAHVYDLGVGGVGLGDGVGLVGPQRYGVGNDGPRAAARVVEIVLRVRVARVCVLVGAGGIVAGLLAPEGVEPREEVAQLVPDDVEGPQAPAVLVRALCGGEHMGLSS